MLLTFRLGDPLAWGTTAGRCGTLDQRAVNDATSASRLRRWLDGMDSSGVEHVMILKALRESDLHRLQRKRLVAWCRDRGHPVAFCRHRSVRLVAGARTPREWITAARKTWPSTDVEHWHAAVALWMTETPPDGAIPTSPPGSADQGPAAVDDRR